MATLVLVPTLRVGTSSWPLRGLCPRTSNDPINAEKSWK
jgi:hypothetical protein